MKLKFFGLFVLATFIVLYGFVFNVKMVSASCDPRTQNETRQEPTISGISAPTGTYNPGPIPIAISGSLSYWCSGDSQGGTGFQETSTSVVYVIKNSSGNVMLSRTWNSQACPTPLSCWPGDFNISSTVNASTWASGTYTIKADAYNNTSGASGTEPANTRSSTFVITGPTGILSATNCAIANGNSTCNTEITWSVPDPIPGANTAVTTPTNITVGTGVSGSATRAIPHGSTNFFLYHNGIELATATATAICANNSTWNGTTCSTDPVPSGTITATSCEINNNESTCSDTNVRWSTANLIPGANTAVTANNENRTVSTATSGSGEDIAVRYGRTKFFLYHNSIELNNISITARCVSGTAWDGRICTSSPTGSFEWVGIPGNCVDGHVQVTWSCSPAVGMCDADNSHFEGQVTQGELCGTSVIGECSNPPNHVSPRQCSIGTVSGLSNNISSWTWICNAPGGPSSQCKELKKKPIFIEN